jgi:hypothetical protein
MFDAVSIAESINSWSGLGIKLPKNLAAALEVLNAVRYTEVGHPPRFDVASVTVDNAEDVIRDLADQVVLATPHESGIARLSALQQAKAQVLQGCASRAILLARAAVPDAIKQLTPRFDAAAEQYAEAVAKLPDEITEGALVRGGTAVVEAFGLAEGAAAYLDAVSGWVISTADIAGIRDRDVEQVLRVLRPETHVQLVKLDEARLLPADPALKALNPVYAAAVRLGVQFKIHSLPEAAALRRELLVVTPKQVQMALSS